MFKFIFHYFFIFLIPIKSMSEVAQGYSLRVGKFGEGRGTVTFSSPSGINCGPNITTYCESYYIPNSSINLTASAASGSRFAGWSGACSGTGICRLTMNMSQMVAAQFVPDSSSSSLSLSVTKLGIGSGTVISSPIGIDCGLNCTKTYSVSTQVTLNAYADNGSVFNGWSGACSGMGNCQITIDQIRNVNARFDPVSYSLSVEKSGMGSGTVSLSPGITCNFSSSSLCSGGSYTSGIRVTLTPSPATGSVFAGWSGACSGMGSCQVYMYEARTVWAQFDSVSYLLTVNKSETGTGSGTVISSPGGIDCGSDCAETYNLNTQVTLTPSPAIGSVFKEWSGCNVITGTSCQVTMSGAKTVMAKFDIASYLLTVEKLGTGSGTVTSSSGGIDCGSTCTKTYNLDTSVTLTVSPSSGSRFIEWSGACSGTGTSCQVTMSGAKTVQARFDTSPLEEDLFSYYVPFPQNNDHWSCRYNLNHNSCFLWLNENETQKPCSYIYSSDDILSDCFTVISPLTSHSIDHEQPRPGDDNSTDGSPVNEFQATEGFDNSFGKNSVEWGLASSTVRGLTLIGYFADLNLSNRDLIGLNATQAEIPDGNFDSTILNKANFRGAVLLSTKFRNATGDPDFSNSLLALANFSGLGTRLSGTFDGADMPNADFSGGNFERSSFINTNLQNAKAINANFDQTKLQGANLQKSDLSWATISHAETNPATLFYGSILCAMRGIPTYTPYSPLALASAFYDENTNWIQSIVHSPNDAYESRGLLFKYNCFSRQREPLHNRSIVLSGRVFPCVYTHNSSIQNGNCINFSNTEIQNLLLREVLIDFAPPISNTDRFLALESGNKRFLIYPVNARHRDRSYQIFNWAISSPILLQTSPSSLYNFYVRDHHNLAALASLETFLTLTGSFIPGFNTALSVHDQGIWNINTAQSILIDAAGAVSFGANVAMKAGKVGVAARLNRTSIYIGGASAGISAVQAIATGNWGSLGTLVAGRMILTRIPFKFNPKTFIRNHMQRARNFVQAGITCHMPNRTQSSSASSLFSRSKASLLAGLSSWKVSSAFWESIAEAAQTQSSPIKRMNPFCDTMRMLIACDQADPQMFHVLRRHLNKSPISLRQRFSPNRSNSVESDVDLVTSFKNKFMLETLIGKAIGTHDVGVNSWLNNSGNNQVLDLDIMEKSGNFAIGETRHNGHAKPEQLKYLRVTLKKTNGSVSGFPFCVTTTRISTAPLPPRRH